MNISSKKLYVYEGELYYGMKRLGDVLISDDGYFAWWPDRENRGFMDAAFLRNVAALLDSMNEEWHTSLTETLKEVEDEH